MTVAMTAVIDALRHRERRARRGRGRPAPPSAIASRTRSVIWYSRSRKPSGPRPARQVLDVARHRVDEVVHLRRRSSGRSVAASAAIARIAPTKTIVDREPAPCDAAPLQPSTRRVEREREEDRDEDPDQDALRGLDDLRSGRCPARMIPSTTRIARGRKRTRRSSSIDARIRRAADGAAQRALNVNGPHGRAGLLADEPPGRVLRRHGDRGAGDPDLGVAVDVCARARHADAARRRRLVEERRDRGARCPGWPSVSSTSLFCVFVATGPVTTSQIPVPTGPAPAERAQAHLVDEVRVRVGR